MPIRILDAATVGRISAGEVVERPASVVKELMENSLDAGATSITVEIRGGGIEYLRITDNGCGIEPGQVRLAFENHATSKLQTAEQLDDIRTMGFRGEALPSVAAVSKIEMTTRCKSEETGVRYTSEGGKNIAISEVGCPQGTTIVMRDLFFNVPVRRAFLKKPAYEGGLVSDTVSRLLLGNPGVSVRYISGGNTIYHSRGDGKLRNAVFSVYGRETANAMTEIDAFEGGTRIKGLIGTGELGKQTRAHQLFFINGRSVRCPMLTKALETVCRSRVTIGLYPMCVLSLTLPPSSVDVNVHPNKLEVRFRDEENMRDTVERLLGKAFEGERVLDMERLAMANREAERTVPRITKADTAPAQLKTEKTPIKTIEIANPAPVKTVPVPTIENEPRQVPAKPQMPPIRGLDTPIAEAPKRAVPAPPPMPVVNVLRETPNHEIKPIRTVDLSGGKQNSVKADHTIQPAAEPAKVPEVKVEQISMLPKIDAEKKDPDYRVIGVVFKTYILIESGDMMLMIDQHAAHERLQYERLSARMESGTASQQLLTPIVITVSPRELSVVADNLDTLQEAGYSVETFGERDLRISAVPFVLGKAEIRPLFMEMLGSLSRLKNATADIRRGEVMQMACKSAVKGGDDLSASEIDALIRELRETGAPSTCPHGRPVVKVLTRRDMEKMFKRIQ